MSSAPAGRTCPQRKHPGLGRLCPGALRLVTAGVLPDLRWNNIGLLGGRALVNSLPRNRALWRLELAGNNIPGDVLRAVGTRRATSHRGRGGSGLRTGMCPGVVRQPKSDTGRRGRRGQGRGMAWRAGGALPCPALSSPQCVHPSSAPPGAPGTDEEAEAPWLVALPRGPCPCLGGPATAGRGLLGICPHVPEFMAVRGSCVGVGPPWLRGPFPSVTPTTQPQAQ